MKKQCIDIVLTVIVSSLLLLSVNLFASETDERGPAGTFEQKPTF